MCVNEFFFSLSLPSKKRKPVWVEWEDPLWSHQWVIYRRSSSVITSMRWYISNTFPFIDMFEFAIKETDSSVSVFILAIVGLLLKIRLMLPRCQWLAALLTVGFGQHVHTDSLQGHTWADCSSIKCLSRPNHSRGLLTGFFHLWDSIQRPLISKEKSLIKLKQIESCQRLLDWKQATFFFFLTKLCCLSKYLPLFCHPDPVKCFCSERQLFCSSCLSI